MCGAGSISSRFLVRRGIEPHRWAYLKAKQENTSLNALMREAIERELD
jgi:predicted HicB family RNase H-like nuclease